MDVFQLASNTQIVFQFNHNLFAMQRLEERIEQHLKQRLVNLSTFVLMLIFCLFAHSHQGFFEGA
jgi:hypothetical protein